MRGKPDLLGDALHAARWVMPVTHSATCHCPRGVQGGGQPRCRRTKKEFTFQNITYRIARVLPLLSFYLVQRFLKPF